MHKICVIIVTYNGEKWIAHCLDCLLKSNRPVDVIVVDNDSKDNTLRILRGYSSDIALIEQKENLGFGQANNIGIKVALEKQADYCFLLNQDAYVYPDTIDHLLSASRQHPDYGIVSPVQLDGRREKMDPLFKKFVSNGYSVKEIEKIMAAHSNHPSLCPVRFVNAAAWFMSRDCVEKTGLFDPLFYHYGEDNNYCYRAQYHGFKVGIAPRAAVCHDKVYTLSKKQLLFRQLHLVPLSILLDLRKNVVLSSFLVAWKFIGYFWKGITRGSGEICRKTFQELGWFLRHFRSLMNSRRESKQPFRELKKGGKPSQKESAF